MQGTVFLVWSTFVFSGDALLDRDTCGRECLRQIASFYSQKHGKSQFVDLLPSSKAPFSFADLISASRQLNFHSEAVEWKDSSTATFPCPAILHVKGTPDSRSADHFITCFGDRGGKLDRKSVV